MASKYKKASRSWVINRRNTKQMMVNGFSRQVEIYQKKNNSIYDRVKAFLKGRA